MSAVTGIVAGLITVAGAIALVRHAGRKAREFQDALAEARRNTDAERGGAVLEYERDPESGVFRPKS